MTRNHSRHQRSKWRSLYVWHRYLGLTAALFMLIIASSGLLLNHTEGLQLDKRFTKNPALLDHYGIKSSDPVSFTAGEHWISQIDSNLYFDTQSLGLSPVTLVGAVQLQNIIVIASGASVHLLTIEGELIETLTADSGIEAPVSAIGLSDTGQIILRSLQSQYALNQELTMAIPVVTTSPVAWSEVADLPADVRQRIHEKAFATALPAERVILDIHSGRFFGNLGVYIFDLFAIIFIFLSISGSTIWFKQHLKYRQHWKKHWQKIK